MCAHKKQGTSFLNHVSISQLAVSETSILQRHIIQILMTQSLGCQLPIVREVQGGITHERSPRNPEQKQILCLHRPHHARDGQFVHSFIHHL